MERLEGGLNQLRKELEALRRWPINPGDTIGLAHQKLIAVADLNLRIAEVLLNR